MENKKDDNYQLNNFKFAMLLLCFSLVVIWCGYEIKNNEPQIVDAYISSKYIDTVLVTGKHVHYGQYGMSFHVVYTVYETGKTYDKIILKDEYDTIIPDSCAKIKLTIER